MQHFLQDHAVFIVPIAVSFATQLIKFLLFGLKHGWKWEYLITHGHMPSSHTAFAISLLTSVGYYEGIKSGTFAVAVALAFLVIDDAVRLRMYLGDQGRYLNMLVQELHLDEGQFPRLKERVGHRTNEVIAGAFVGFFLTVVLIHFMG